MSHFLLLLITLILFPLSISSQNTGSKIPIGSSITATTNSKPWLSKSGDFAFGFLPNPNHTTNLFILAIWFDKIPSKTIFWFDRNLAPLGSILTLEANGLILRDTNHNVLQNYTGGLAASVAYAFMNDTGNFVLSGTDSDPLWQSFKNPSDTILPTQTIEVNGPNLISKNRKSDFSYGRFYGGMSNDGNFVLNTKSVFTNLDFDDEYYNSEVISGNRLVFDSEANISVVDKNGERLQTILDTNLSPSDYYFRATLEFDGVFVLYAYPKKGGINSMWIANDTLPRDNICMGINGQKGSGACGFNNVCSLNDTSLRPICKCPEGFLLVDPSNVYGDCKSNFTENCVDKGEYGLVEVKDVDWPFNDYEQRNKSSLDECRKACYEDNFCGAAIFRSDSCWKKRLPLSNGRVDKSLKATAFLKVLRLS
ncbi:hypothetical protein CASFOL_008596 [Castilleja foliolosa]|uniref:Bulb-type lectin domain-containing protein n=1 Tax=Castilleja foliolosa TaxID=1961234 RepID=A0ABD3DZP5_9LAMI